MAAPKLSLVPEGEPPQRTEHEGPVEVWPSPAQPLEVAYALADERTGDLGVRLVQHWRDSWWEFRGVCWVEIEEKAVRNWVYNRLRDAVYRVTDRNGEAEEKAWNPDTTKVNKVIDAYGSAVALLPRDVEPGTWLPTMQRVPGVIATAAGLFNLADRKTYPGSPALFTTWA